MKFGRDSKAGAKRKELIDVRSLVEHPGRPAVLAAWKTTFDELGGLFGFCKENEIPVILVVFPFRFQFEDVRAKSWPQEVVTQYAREKGIPVLDLLPILDKVMEERGKKPEDYFLDSNHPSAPGNEVVAEAISDFIIRELASTLEQQP